MNELGQIDINSKDEFGKTIIHYAASSSNSEVLEYVVKLNGLKLTDQCSNNENALHIACKTSQIDNVKILVELNKFDLRTKSENNKTLLHYACENGDYDLFKYLYKFHQIDICDKDDDNNNLLHSICKSNNYIDINFVKFLISQNKFDLQSRPYDRVPFLRYTVPIP